MPWAALAGMAVSYLGSRSASRSQDRAQDSQDQYNERMLGIEEDKLGFAREQYEKHESRFGPVFDQMMQELDQDLTPNYGIIAGDVKSSFQSARGQERRSMERYGVRPNDGRFARSERQYGIAEAGAHVGARSSARESKRGLKYARLADVYGMGQGLQATNASMMNNAFTSSSNAFGNAASMYGNRANQYGIQAGNDAAGWGAAVGGVDWGGIWGDVKGWFNNSGGGANPGGGPGGPPI